MSAIATEPFDLTLTRTIRVGRERVFDALVDSHEWLIWHCPRAMRVTYAESDARPGGAWRLGMQTRDGNEFRVKGVYRVVERPSRLVFTWESETMTLPPTLVEVTLRAEGDTTHLEMRHTGFSSKTQVDSHQRGWNSTVNRLIEHLDPRGSAAVLTLYGVGPSSYTRTARLALAEKGVACAFEECPPHSEAILRLNPFGHLPAFTDGDYVVHETSAIARYVDEAFEGPPLLPDSMAGRARCEQWVSAFKDHLYGPLVRRYIRPIFFPQTADGEPDRDLVAPALEELPGLLAIWEAGYARSPWLAGDSLSLADLFVMPPIAYLELMPDGPRLLGNTPNLRRALAAMRHRPSFAPTAPGGRFGS